MDRASVECYDPSTDDWTFVTEMEKARSGLSLIAIDHNIYMIGGRYKTADQYFDVAERYKVYSYSGLHDIVFIVKSEIILTFSFLLSDIFTKHSQAIENTGRRHVAAMM